MESIKDCGSDNECCVECGHAVKEVTPAKNAGAVKSTEHTPTLLNILDLYVANCRECGCEDVDVSFDDKAVRAVNSHEALLRACKKIQAWFDKAPDNVRVTVPIGDLNEAIAQAEGK